MTTITIKATIHAPLKKVWRLYTVPKHITQWNHASQDWHTPRAENDLQVGGRFLFRMEAKDGSAGFDFIGKYDEIRIYELISYSMEDGRKVSIAFLAEGKQTKMEITFETENENPIEMQREGWQAILNNFRKYVESQS